MMPNYYQIKPSNYRARLFAVKIAQARVKMNKKVAIVARVAAANIKG